VHFRHRYEQEVEYTYIAASEEKVQGQMHAPRKLEHGLEGVRSCQGMEGVSPVTAGVAEAETVNPERYGLAPAAWYQSQYYHFVELGSHHHFAGHFLQVPGSETAENQMLKTKCLASPSKLLVLQAQGPAPIGSGTEVAWRRMVEMLHEFVQPVDIHGMLDEETVVPDYEVGQEYQK
jgi:hypothetical protein